MTFLRYLFSNGLLHVDRTTGQKAKVKPLTGVIRMLSLWQPITPPFQLLSIQTKQVYDNMMSIAEQPDYLLNYCNSLQVYWLV